MTEPLSIEALAQGLARRGTPLAAESGLFIVLEAVEAMASRPLWLTPAGVRVGADGVVSLAGSLDTVSVLESMTSVLDTLESVLMPPPAGALTLAARVKAGEVETLPVFTSELEALLVPLNRSAARRMLGRLVREHIRAQDRPGEPSPDRHGEPSPDRHGEPSPDRHDEALGALLAGSEPAATSGVPPGSALKHPVAVRGSASALDTEPDADPGRHWRTADERELSDRADDRDDVGGGLQTGVPRRGQWTGGAAVVLAALALLAAGVFLYHRLQRAESRASRREGSDHGVVEDSVRAVVTSRGVP